MSDISFPGLLEFVIVLAIGALCAVGLVVSLGVFSWAAFARRPVARRRAGKAVATFGVAVLCAAALAVALD